MDAVPALLEEQTMKLDKQEKQLKLLIRTKQSGVGVPALDRIARKGFSDLSPKSKEHSARAKSMCRFDGAPDTLV